MRFCWSTLAVKDMDESLKFYQEIVGLKLTGRFGAGPGKEIAFLGDGDTKIELLHDKENKEICTGKDISWGFEVENVDEFYAMLKEKGVKTLSEPESPAPNTRFFFASDPNGMKLQFVQTSGSH
ncbi:MAG: VOC family protein [Clostridiales bacterium]|nr:VOC family protein [Clostridiales bacterium]